MKKNTIVLRSALGLLGCAFAALAARVAVTAAGARPGARLRLDASALAPADGPVLWMPAPGRHTLRLVDEKGAELDRVQFTVRGLALRRAIFMQDSP
jgi:penicillin-binding protein 1C